MNKYQIKKLITILLFVNIFCLIAYARNATWYNNNGTTYFNNGEYDKAIADYTEAIRLDSKNRWAYAYRCVAYREKGEYDNAIADCTEVIRLDPSDVWAYNERGEVYSIKGDYDMAIKDYESILRMNPNDTKAKQNLVLAQKRIRAKQYIALAFLLMLFGFGIWNRKKIIPIWTFLLRLGYLTFKTIENINIIRDNQQFVCPYCMRSYKKKKVTQHKCPHCYKNIPRTALETPNLPFSIIGISNSGKTNFITVMLHELSRAPRLRLVLNAQNEETEAHQNENYKRIYEDHAFLAQTEHNEYGMPQIWSIKNLSKKYRNNVPTYTFTIFDGAGESHEKLNKSSVICRYIEISKAIIFTLDPLTLPNIRKGGIVDENTMRNSLAGSKGETKNAVEIVNNVAAYIRATLEIKETKILDIPVAVVLTKFDTILSHKFFGPNALIRNESLNIQNGKVNVSEIQQVDQEIRNWLNEIGENSFIDALESNFKEFCFFGVSSYGEPPKNANTLSDHIRPHRVLDPILWLFKKAKFID